MPQLAQAETKKKKSNTIQYFINPFLLGFSGLIYIRLKIELNISNKIITYLLLAECEVRTASYGPSFFPSFYGPSAKRAGHENKEGKTEDP